MQRERYKRRLMGPIFEKPPLLRFPPGGRVDQRTVIGSKSGERRQVVGADKDIDAVDLVQGEPVDGFQPARRRDFLGTRAAETLGCEGDPPGPGERKLFHLRHFTPPGGTRWRSTS